MPSIRIVKRHRQPREKAVSCDKCSAWLRVEPGAAVTRDQDRDGPYVKFTCPACGADNYVHADVWDGKRG